MESDSYFVVHFVGLVRARLLQQHMPQLDLSLLINTAYTEAQLHAMRQQQLERQCSK